VVIVSGCDQRWSSKKSPLRVVEGLMKIFRQHTETELPEIVGKLCSEIVAVPSDEENVVYSLYLRVEETWLRIFIQAGLLFADECSGPDPEDDLSEDEKYLDLGDGRLTGISMVKSAVMRNGVFTVCLSCDTLIKLSEVTTGTKIQFITST